MTVSALHGLLQSVQLGDKKNPIIEEELRINRALDKIKAQQFFQQNQRKEFANYIDNGLIDYAESMGNFMFPVPEVFRTAVSEAKARLGRH